MNKIKNMLKSSFLKNILKVFSGTAFAQILGIILLPVITRLYSPEEYGLISLYTAIIVGVSFLGSMNYEMGIPIAKSEEKAVNILLLSIIVLIFSTTILIFIVTFFGNSFLSLFDGDVLVDYKFLIPIGVLFLGLYNIFTQWAYRRKDFNAIMKTKFTQSISNNLVSIGFGLLGKGAIGLIIGKILGQSSGIFTLFYPFLKEDRYLLKKIKKVAIFWAAKRYINFPLYTTPRRFLGDITITLPIFFMTSLYGNQAVGLFGLANSVIQLPMNLVGTSVSNVFYAESASLKSTDPRKVKELSNKLMKNLIFIGLIPFFILIFLGPLLFSFFFGPQWSKAGIFASLLSFSVFSRLVFKPISNLFDIFEKQKLALLLNIFKIILVLAVFGVSGYLSLNSYWAIGLYSLAMSLIYFIQYLLAQKILENEISIYEKTLDR